jgi:hypothetical protein
MGYSEGNSASERHNRALLRELAGIRERISLLCSTGIRSGSSAQHESVNAQQSLISGGQQLMLPLSADSHTRRLAEALNREVQFKTRAV